MNLRDFIQQELPQPVTGRIAWCGILKAGQPMRVPISERDVLDVMRTTSSPVIYRLCEDWIDANRNTATARRIPSGRG